MLNTIGDYKAWNDKAWAWGAQRGAGWVWRNTQAAVGYAISNIGVVRAQFVGAQVGSGDASLAYDGDKLAIDKNPAATRIEAAFAFTGIKGLTIDLGGKVFLPVTDPEIEATDKWDDSYATEDYSYWRGIGVGLGVKYAADPLTVNFIIDATRLGANSTYDPPAPESKIETSLGFDLKPYVAVAYKLNDTFTAQVEGGLEFIGDGETTTTVAGASTTATIDGEVRYGFGAGLQTTLAPSCTIKTGITFAGSNADVDHGVLSVPIIFSVSF
jgi:hypothetical protein